MLWQNYPFSHYTLYMTWKYPFLGRISRNICWFFCNFFNKGWSLKNLPKCSESKFLATNLENGNKNPNIFYICPWGKKWVVNRCSKLNSYRDINFLRWSITDELWRLSVSHTFLNTYKHASNTNKIHISVIIGLWKMVHHSFFTSWT